MAATHISRSMATNGNSGKLTISVWVKRSSLGEKGICGSWYSGAYHGILYFSTNNNLVFYDYRNGYIMRKVTNATFRDLNSWYHIVCNFDHTLGSPTAKIYVNGELQSLSTDTNYSQGATSSWLTDYTLNIGSYSGSGNYLDGILADFYFIQGYVYEASTFGETDSTSGFWKPKLDPTINYGGTGGNSCHLKFENSANMDLDSGSNNLTFTTSGTLTQTVDNPSHNFTTLNPYQTTGNASLNDLANGNLTYTGHSGTSYSGVYSSFAAASGKYYAEFKCTGGAGAVDMMMGVGNGIGNGTAPGAGAQDYVIFGYDGKIYNNGSGSTYGTALTSGDIICVAVDLDNNKLYFRKNGDAWFNSGNPESGSTGTGAQTLSASTTGVYHFLIGDYGGSGTPTCNANFGNGFFGTTAITSEGTNASNHGKFEYDVPTGYTALSTKGLNE